MNDDPLIRRLRQEISDTDRAIVDSLNVRLRLVARLKSYKESRGIGFVDPEREEWMLQYLQRANRGPLSNEGLKELFEANPGSLPVRVRFLSSQGITPLDVGTFRVDASGALLQRIGELLGGEAARVEREPAGV